MFKPYWGICNGKKGGKRSYDGCGEMGWITTGSRLLCTVCERARQNPTYIKKTSLKPKFPKSTGQYVVFEEIARERPHVCYVTGTPVNVFTRDGALKVSCFMHVVSKGANRALIIHKPNIQIVHDWVHTVYDRGNEQERKKMEAYPGWHRLLRLHDEILEWYALNKKRART